MRRRDVVALGAAWLTLPRIARTQPAASVRRIGVIASARLRPIDSFNRKLQELGYVAGRNVVLENRFSDGRDDRYPAFAAELAALPVDVIVAWGTPAALAAKRATTRIPVVIVAGDVSDTGIVANLARPEANVTGFTAVNVELEAKRLELLKEAVPGLSRVAILVNTGNPLNAINLQTARRVGRELSIAIDVFEVDGGQDLDGALRRLVDARPHAALLAADTSLLRNRKRIVETMAASRIPALYPFREYSDVGGLMTYGANIAVLFERAAEYVERILKGERPANLPVQQATSFELVINRKVAAGLGLTIPSSVLLRADEIVD